MPIPFGYLREPLVFLLVGAAAVVPLLLLNVRLAPRLGLIDWPKIRGVTEEQIPIVGHSLVLLTIGALALFVQFHFVSPWFLVTAVILGVMGHLDDRRPLPPLDKFLFQLACAAVVVYLDPQLYKTFTLKFGPWGSAWAILFLLGIVNAVNFIDGIDGLAGIVIAIGAAGFLALAPAEPDMLPLRCVAALIIGMMGPFLYTNVTKRRGFLGNVGSYFFSYVLGMLHLSIPTRAPAAIMPEWLAPLPVLMLSALCFIIPVADSFQVILSRVFTGRSPFQPDRGHLHHRLLQTTLPLRSILLTFGLLEVAGLASASAVAVAPSTVRESFLPLILGAAQIGGIAGLILLVERSSRKRLRSYFQRLDNDEPIYFLRYKLRNRDGRPITKTTLRRLEARVGAEIRVTDTCFADTPDELFVTLKTLPEPKKNIMGRIGVILQNEDIVADEAPQQGEYVKTQPINVRRLKSS